MSLVALGIAAILVLVNGFFVAVEFAYTASRRQNLEAMAGEGNRFAVLALKSMDELPMTFAGAQLGVAAASLGLGFVMEPSLAGLFETVFDWVNIPESAGTPIALVIALLIAAFFHNVLGEMAPKNATIAAPERTALLLALPFRAYMTTFRPLIWALTGAALGIIRLFGVNPRQSIESTHSAADIESMVRSVGAKGIIEDASSQLLTAAIGFRETLVAEVMAPRPDLVALPVESSPSLFEETVVATGHTRIPVFETGLDDLRGFVHAKDLLGVPPEEREQPISRSLIRDLPVVPESTSIAPVMELMRSTRTHIAAAIDEYGATAGLLTLEDIAEEIVGEIRDEHDSVQLAEIRRAGRNRLLVAGKTRIDRLDDVGIHLPEGEYETIGGLVMDRLGRVPTFGDVVEQGNHRLTVRRMDRRRVREVEIRTIQPPTRNQKGADR